MVMTAPQLVRTKYIQWAQELYADMQDEYEKYDSYYDGDQDLVYSTDRWIEAFGNEFEDFADNWCGVVVDAPAQRLEIIGWKCNDKKISKLAEEIWDREDVADEEEDLTLQAFIKGDAYMMVWDDPEWVGEDEEAEDGRAQLFFNDALDINVHYDPRNKKRIDRASKKWMTSEGRLHLVLYYRDRIVHYEAKEEGPRPLDDWNLEIDPQDIPPDGWVIQQKLDNPYNEIPIFHFKNRPRGSTHGMSELKSVIPVQNSCNKVLMDMMLGSEFAGFPQKWMAGGGHPKDGWRAGANRVWATTDSQAKFGQFDSMDLGPSREFVEMLVSHIAKITQTPMHYLRSMGDMPSGEALKTAESGLVHKVKNRQKRWGKVWTKAIAFAIRIETGQIVTPSMELQPVWKFPETRHDLEQAQTAQLKSILGVPLSQLWSEHFGYTEEQIAQFEKENRAIAASTLAQVIAQSGQLPPGMDQLSDAGLTPADIVTLLQNAQSGGEGSGVNLAQVLASIGKGQTSQTTAGEATTKPQPNTVPPASPTRRSRGFKD